MNKVLFCSNLIHTDLGVSCFRSKLSNFIPKTLVIPVNKHFHILSSKAKVELDSNDHLNIDDRGILPGNTKFDVCKKYIHVNRSDLAKRDKSDRRSILAKAVRKDDGSEGEKAPTLDIGLSHVRGFGDIFPDETTNDKLYDGVRYCDLPIVHINLSKNNTKLDVTDSKGSILLFRSAGIEGFKNAKRGTNIAAQSTATTIATQAVEKGVRNVRVTINGLGAGRLTAPKGLTVGGLNVVSITDVTPLSFDIYPRPRKMRK